jgi:hypothetical protein
MYLPPGIRLQVAAADAERAALVLAHPNQFDSDEEVEGMEKSGEDDERRGVTP